LLPAAVKAALAKSAIFAANLARAAMRQTQELRAHIEQLTLFDAEQRVGSFLQYVRQSDFGGDLDIDLPFDKVAAASYLGIKPETLSRALHAFRDKGFAVENRHITLPDEMALCGYCDSVTATRCQHHMTPKCPERG